MPFPFRFAPVALFICCLLWPAAAASPDLVRLRSQLAGSVLPDAADPQYKLSFAPIDAGVDGLLAQLNASGLWPDIAYHDDGRSDWAAATHLRRCLELGVAQASPLSTHFNDSRMTAATHQCLWGWLQGNFVNSNWWWMQFGTLQVVAKLLLVAPNTTLLTMAQATTFPRLTEKDVMGFTAANRIWGATVLVLVGALSDNDALVDRAMHLAHEAYAITSGDGIQADHSFHQHGAIAYFSYGYGSHFLCNALMLEIVCQGTRWKATPTQWAVLAAYLLDGARWVTRGACSLQVRVVVARG
jgi:chondroitin AC lyase